MAVLDVLHTMLWQCQDKSLILVVFWPTYLAVLQFNHMLIFIASIFLHNIAVYSNPGLMGLSIVLYF